MASAGMTHSHTSLPGRRDASNAMSVRQPLKSPTSHIEVAFGAHSRNTQRAGLFPPGEPSSKCSPK